MKLKVSIVSADRTFYDGVADIVVMKTLNGQVGIMANHVPMMTILKDGWVRIKNDGEESLFDIESAVAKVIDNQLDVLSFN